MVRFTQKLSLPWRYSTEARDESTLWIVMNPLFEIIRANKIHVLLTHHAKERGAVTLHIRHTWPQEAIRLSDQFRGGPGFPRSAKEGAGPDQILTVLESWPLWHISGNQRVHGLSTPGLDDQRHLLLKEFVIGYPLTFAWKTEFRKTLNKSSAFMK